MSAATAGHVQVRFFTKQERFAIPDTPYSVPVTLNLEDLGKLVSRALTDDGNIHPGYSFDFLIGGEFLRVPLDEYIEQKSVATENVLEIEYVERHPAPSPKDSLQHDDWVGAVRATGDCILSGSYDGMLHVWSHGGEKQLTIPAHQGAVKSVDWLNCATKDATSFVSASHDQTLIIWILAESKARVEKVSVCKGHSRSVEAVAAAPDGDRFCSGSVDGMLKLWSVQDDGGQEECSAKRLKGEMGKSLTRTPVMTLSGHSESVSCVCWLSDREISTASLDHTIRIWDSETGQNMSTLSGSKAFLSISYSPINQSLISGNVDRHVRLWDPRSKEGTLVKSVYSSHTGWVSCVSWSRTDSNLFVSGSFDKCFKLWDIRSTKASLFDMLGHEDRILCCDWSFPGLMISGGVDNTVKFFSTSK